MIDFDHIVLYPGYSEIKSRMRINPYTKLFDMTNSTTYGATHSFLPIILANMTSLYSEDFIRKIHDNGIIPSIPRQGINVNDIVETWMNKYTTGIDCHNTILDNTFISIGTKEDQYELAKNLINLGVKKLLVDVNHGHHLMVKEMIKYLKIDLKFDGIIMAGNVSSIKGIEDLFDWGANIVKIGNSFGSACSTLIKTGFGVHGLHVCKEFTDSGLKDQYFANNKYICLDGGIRCFGDIAKSLIYSDLVMVGKLFAGTTESGCKISKDKKTKRYFGNASLEAKKLDGIEFPRNIEGQSIDIPHSGSLEHLVEDMFDGLRSALSFVGASNLYEYQQIARKNVVVV